MKTADQAYWARQVLGGGSNWRGGMTLAQVEILERTFAKFIPDNGYSTPGGPMWVTPMWVTRLKAKIINAMECQ